MVLTCNCIAGHCFVGLRFFSIHKLNEVTGISDGFFLVPGFELKRATGRASSRQLAPGCGRIARRSSLEHPHPMPLYPQIVLQTPFLKCVVAGCVMGQNLRMPSSEYRGRKIAPSALGFNLPGCSRIENVAMAQNR